MVKKRSDNTRGFIVCLIDCVTSRNKITSWFILFWGYDRPFGIPAEGTNRLIFGHWEKKGNGLVFGHWEKKGKAHLSAASPRETGAAPGAFCPVSNNDTFSLSLPPDLLPVVLLVQIDSSKLGEVLLSMARVQQGADPGRSMLPRGPRSLTSPAANGEQKPPAAPRVTEAIQINSCLQACSPSHRALSAQCRPPLLYSRKLANTWLPISRLTARWVRIRRACAASDCDTRDKTPSGISDYTLQTCILEVFVINGKEKKKLM